MCLCGNKRREKGVRFLIIRPNLQVNRQTEAPVPPLSAATPLPVRPFCESLVEVLAGSGTLKNSIPRKRAPIVALSAFQYEINLFRTPQQNVLAHPYAPPLRDGNLHGPVVLLETDPRFLPPNHLHGRGEVPGPNFVPTNALVIGSVDPPDLSGHPVLAQALRPKPHDRCIMIVSMSDTAVRSHPRQEEPNSSYQS